MILLGDWAPKLHSVKSVLNFSQDLCIANLEGPILSANHKFVASPKAGPNLFSSHLPDRSQRFVFALANNHMMDYGLPGLEATCDLMRRHGFKACGAGMNRQGARQSIIIEERGIHVGMISCCEAQFGVSRDHSAGVAEFGPWVYHAIHELRKRAEVVVVSVHAGVEDSPWPSPYIRDLYRSFIDAGATVVHGHHAHIPQGYEAYGQGVIFYGMGNFAVDPDQWRDDPNALWSLAVEVDVHFQPVHWRPLTLKIHRPRGSDTIVIEESNDEQRSNHHDYLEVCNRPLRDADLLEALWQEVAIRAYHHYGAEYAGFAGSSLKKNLRKIKNALFNTSLNLHGDQYSLMLRYHMLACESHRQMLRTALGVLAGEIKDSRTNESRTLADKMISWRVKTAPIQCTAHRVQNERVQKSAAEKVLQTSKTIALRAARSMAFLKKFKTSSVPNYFVSQEHVYLASADNYKGLEGVVESEELLPCKHFYSVIGGMGGLNVLCRLDNVKTITWFDLNPHMIEICHLMLKLTRAARTIDDFVSLIYCKPFRQNIFSPDTIDDFYKQPVSDVLRSRLSEILSEEELKTYDRFYHPYTSPPQQEFVLGPSLHCTSLKVYHDAPIDGVMTYPFLSREYIQTHRTKSVNSFFLGKGWLANEARFQQVRKLLNEAEIFVNESDILKLDPPDESGLYASNVFEGTEDSFPRLIDNFDWTIWFSRRTKYLTAEYALSDRQIIPCEKVFSCDRSNAHKNCCCLLDEILNIGSRRFLEVIQPGGMEGMNSGFRFYDGQRKTHVNHFLRDGVFSQDVSLVMLHMLMGNGCAFEVWKRVVEQAIRSGLTVCVFEHNPTARDWPEPEVQHGNLPPIVMIDRFLLAAGHGWRKYGTISKTGKGVRNYCWILDAR